jgi:hypothetical protein
MEFLKIMFIYRCGRSMLMVVVGGEIDGGGGDDGSCGNCIVPR